MRSTVAFDGCLTVFPSSYVSFTTSSKQAGGRTTRIATGVCVGEHGPRWACGKVCLTATNTSFKLTYSEPNKVREIPTLKVSTLSERTRAGRRTRILINGYSYQIHSPIDWSSASC
jgi:hypothetical protein